MLPGPLTSCVLAWAHLSRSRPTWPHGVAWEQWPPGPRSLAQWPEVPSTVPPSEAPEKDCFPPRGPSGHGDTQSAPSPPPHTHTYIFKGCPGVNAGTGLPRDVELGEATSNSQTEAQAVAPCPLFLGPGGGVRVPSPRRPHSVGSGGCLRVQGRPGEWPKRALSRGLGSPCGGETKVTGLPGPPSCLSKFTHRPPCWTQKTGTSHSQCSLGEGWAGS